jgi:hypothetical protein
MALYGFAVVFDLSTDQDRNLSDTAVQVLLADLKHCSIPEVSFSHYINILISFIFHRKHETTLAENG